MQSVRPWWLQSLYALLLLSVVALVTLLVGEIYYAFEDAQTRRHGDWGPIFRPRVVRLRPDAARVARCRLIALIVGWAVHRRR